MNKIEQAAQAVQPGHQGELTPLQRSDFAPVTLCTPAWIAAAAGTVAAGTAVFTAGNAASDFVGEHANPEVEVGFLDGKSGTELLNIRHRAIGS